MEFDISLLKRLLRQSLEGVPAVLLINFLYKAYTRGCLTELMFGSHPVIFLSLVLLQGRSLGSCQRSPRYDSSILQEASSEVREGVYDEVLAAQKSCCNCLPGSSFSVGLRAFRRVHERLQP